MNTHSFRLLTLLLCTALLVPAARAQHFSPDPTFQTPDVRSSQPDLRAVHELPGGKLLVGGTFDYGNGAPAANLARLAANGAPDPAFRADLPSPVRCLALQPDGKILVGTLRHGITRLNADGSRDNTFNPGKLNRYEVRSIALQPDGKILAGGDVVEVNGGTRSGLARLLPDGSPDPDFTTQGALYSFPYALVVLPNGKVLVGGHYYDNTPPYTYLLRLNPDGSRDGTFNIGGGPTFPVSALLVGPDQKILVSGSFPIRNGTYYSKLTRLHPDGTVDDTFRAGVPEQFTADAYSLVLQPDGKILVGGQFQAGGKQSVLRLMGNGSLDDSFTASLPSQSRVNAVRLLSSGKILLAGAYYGGIVRVTATGSRDNAFMAYFEKRGRIEKIITARGGKTVLTGDFDTINGKAAPNVARLLADGRLDPAFNAPAGVGIVSSAAVQPDGKLLVAPPQNSPFPKLVRLGEDGKADPAFTPGSTVEANASYRLIVQPDGKILTSRQVGGGLYTAALWRLKADGSTDEAFAPGKATRMRVMALQPDGKILVGGDFWSFNDAPIKSIIRLNADGTVDAGFRAAITQDGAINGFAVLPDGKIIVAGSGNHYNGVWQPTLFRLHPDGRLDDSYRSGFRAGWDTLVHALALRTDGKLVVSGTSRTGTVLLRMSADGALDNTFTTGGIGSQPVHTFAMPADDSLLVAVPGGLLRLVAPRSQAITFPAVPDKLSTDAPFALQATASSGLPVSYRVVSGPATVAGNLVTLAGTPGTVTVRASQAGNDAYAAAPDAEITFRVETVLGAEERAAAVTVYPNPAPGRFRIETPLRVAAADVGLYDARGQAVATWLQPVPGGYSLVVPNSRPGLYVLRVRTGKSEIVRKIFLQ